VHLYFVVPTEQVWETIRFVSRKLLQSLEDLPEEFVGLRLEPVVFGTPDMDVHLGLTLNSEATQRQRETPDEHPA